MGDDPFVAALVAPELGAGHVETAPPDPPFLGIGFTVGFGDEWFELGTCGVHAGEPGFGGFLIMAPADLPMCIDFEVALEVEEEVIGRHFFAVVQSRDKGRLALSSLKRDRGVLNPPFRVDVIQPTTLAQM